MAFLSRPQLISNMAGVFRVSARRLSGGSFFESASEWAIKASGYRKYGAAVVPFLSHLPFLRLGS